MIQVPAEFRAYELLGDRSVAGEEMDAHQYLEAISLVERLHRQLLEVVKLELDGLSIHDINSVQGMMLFNIGEAEMTVGELTLRGCYLGSNVSYNVKKMVENGYIVQERSVYDRRSIHVRLTEKGRALRDRLSGMHRRHIEMLVETQITTADLEGVVATLRRLERFWLHATDPFQRNATSEEVGTGHQRQRHPR